MAIKKIRGRVEVHAETRWVAREDGASELVVDAFRIEHRDGSVEFAPTPQEAFNRISAHARRSARAVERKDPKAQVMWITTIDWYVPPGTEIPTCEVRT